jgi:hypothetical protein
MPQTSGGGSKKRASKAPRKVVIQTVRSYTTQKEGVDLAKVIKRGTMKAPLKKATQQVRRELGSASAKSFRRAAKQLRRSSSSGTYYGRKKA